MVRWTDRPPGLDVRRDLIGRLKQILIAVPFALSLIACGQLDVNESPSGTSQSPAQYGTAAGKQPVVVLSAAQAQRLKRIMDPLIRHMNHPIPSTTVKVTVLQDSHINAEGYHTFRKTAYAHVRPSKTQCSYPNSKTVPSSSLE